MYSFGCPWTLWDKRWLTLSLELLRFEFCLTFFHLYVLLLFFHVGNILEIIHFSLESWFSFTFPGFHFFSLMSEPSYELYSTTMMATIGATSRDMPRKKDTGGEIERELVSYKDIEREWGWRWLIERRGKNGLKMYGNWQRLKDGNIEGKVDKVSEKCVSSFRRENRERAKKREGYRKKLRYRLWEKD